MSATPSFVTSRVAEQFSPGDPSASQLYYREQSERIVRMAVETIKQAIETKQELPSLFFSLLQTMGEERRSIAKHCGTSRAECFGVRRDVPLDVLVPPPGKSSPHCPCRHSNYSSIKCHLSAVWPTSAQKMD